MFWPLEHSYISRGGIEHNHWIVQVVRDGIGTILFIKIALMDCMMLYINRDGRHLIAYQHLREVAPVNFPSFPFHAANWLECYRDLNLDFDEYLFEEVLERSRPRVMRLITRHGRYQVIDPEHHADLLALLNFRHG